MDTTAKIVVLDGYTTNPGDLDWATLEALGDVVVHARTTPAEVLARSHGAQALLTNKTVLSAETIAALPALKYIGVLATGYNVVDLDAAAAQGIVVTNVPAYSTPSVAQMVFAHILNITQRVGDHAAQVGQGDWAASKDFCFWSVPLVELQGKTLGLLGYGEIAKAVARIGQAFGMQILVHTRTPGASTEQVRFVDRDTLFAASDVLSLHAPLTPETEHVVNASSLASMKPTAILINTGRGPLVDEHALAEALASARIAAAGLDVLAEEPPREGSPLIGAPNCWITPHIAWATRESRQRLLDTAVGNLNAFLNNTPVNVVAGPGS